MRFWHDQLAERLEAKATDLQTERDRLQAVNAELAEALEKVISWIDNWSPNFTEDDEWPEDRDAARAALAKHQGATA